MRICVVGAGYVGLVTGTCFADSGNNVVCVDSDERKIGALRGGEVPIYEPGLKELIERNSAEGRLAFTTGLGKAIAESLAVFLCVGTPSDEEGKADLGQVFRVGEEIAAKLERYKLVVMKSTVPVGTTQKLAAFIRSRTKVDFDIASNPEFLKEGNAVADFTKPDRVIVGVEHERAGEILRDLYAPYLRTEKPFLVMDVASAEMTKYAANCVLATKISLINEIANICERVGANIDDVRRGIGHDSRIGFQFLFPGLGYGGSCFPKDVHATVQFARAAGYDAQLLRATHEVNLRQRRDFFEKIRGHFGGKLAGRRIAVWGISFKPGTDDIREAPAVDLVTWMLAEGARIALHDRVAAARARERFGEAVEIAERPEDAVRGAEALVVCTDWNEFRHPDFEAILKVMAKRAIFDGRNLYDAKKRRAMGAV
ncbi:MAG: UDP-glucose/GDP-mannose dehydrogenase family protein [Planctomycetota bacterium]